MTKGVVYEAVCSECKSEDSTYIGETARQVGVRANEHFRNAELLKMNSFIVEHWMLKHPLCTEQPKFEFRILSKHKDALSRQVREAVTIIDRGKLNKKNEFGINEIIKMEPSRYEWEQEKERKTIYALENERLSCIKSFITVMAAVRNADSQRIQSLTLSNTGSNFYRKHFTKRKEREMEGQHGGSIKACKRARVPMSSTPIQFRYYRQLDSASGSSSILTSETDQETTASILDGEVAGGSRTELSWDTENVVLEEDKEQEPLIDLLAKKAVMMESFSEAERNYSERKVGAEVKTLLDGVEWEENVKFKKNDSDEHSHEITDILGDDKDLGLSRIFTSETNALETDLNLVPKQVEVLQLKDGEDYLLNLLFEAEHELTEDVEDYGLDLLFVVEHDIYDDVVVKHDIFDEEVVAEDELESRVHGLRKNKLYDIFLMDNKLGSPKRKRSPQQETISKFRRMTIASSPGNNSPALKQPPRKKKIGTRSETAAHKNEVNEQQPKQQLITKFLEGEKK